MKARIPDERHIVYLPETRKADIKRYNGNWKKFQDELSHNVFSIYETEKAMQTIFLNEFDQRFQLFGKDSLEVAASIVFERFFVGRGTILSPSESLTYDRLMPISKFIKKDNRFSPPGVEWLYLAVGSDEDKAQMCSQAECRVKKGDRFGFCRFKLSDGCDDIKVVDLTMFSGNSPAHIDEQFEKELTEIENKAKKEFRKKGYRNPALVALKHKEEQGKALAKWTLSHLTLILNDYIFVPIEDNKESEYAPFQTIALYFQKRGFGG